MVSDVWHAYMFVSCRSIIIDINVEKGDTLESLAETYHIPYEKLLATNGGACQSHIHLRHHV